MAEWIQSFNDAGIPIILWLQGFQSDGLTSFMAAMSWLGLDYFYILFFPLLYWVVSKRLGILTALALSFSVYMADWIKWTFKLPRPPSPPVEILWTETSPGFVSSHASNAVAVWGTLALAVRKWWMTALALFLIFFISLSRLYLGVHYVGDVLGGWLAGLLVLWLVFKAAPIIGRRVEKWSARQQVAGVIVLGLIMLLIFPSNWEGQRPGESGVLDAGILMGFLFGLIWDHHKLRFEVAGPWRQRILRFVVGMVLVLAAFFGLDLLFEPFSQGSYLPAQVLRLVRYTAVGFVVSGLGPWLFQRIRLA